MSLKTYELIFSLVTCTSLRDARVKAGVLGLHVLEHQRQRVLVVLEQYFESFFGVERFPIAQPRELRVASRLEEVLRKEQQLFVRDGDHRFAGSFAESILRGARVFTSVLFLNVADHYLVEAFISLIGDNINTRMASIDQDVILVTATR